MQTFFFKIADVKVKINNGFEAYTEFLKTTLDQVRVSEVVQKNFDVEITIHWQDKSLSSIANNLKKKLSGVQIGANTFKSDTHVISIRKIERKWKVLVSATVRNNKLVVDFYFQRKPFKDFLRYSVRGKPQNEWFYTITYPCFYYPIIWYLENFRSIYALHASAVTCHNKGVVIAGLDGAGKTSLALKFLQEEGSSFLSDNLLFCDRESVHSCFEALRIHSSDNRELWQGKFKQVDEGRNLKGFFVSRI